MYQAINERQNQLHSILATVFAKLVTSTKDKKKKKKGPDEWFSHKAQKPNVFGLATQRTLRFVCCANSRSSKPSDLHYPTKVFGNKLLIPSCCTEIIYQIGNLEIEQINFKINASNSDYSWVSCVHIKILHLRSMHLQSQVGKDWSLQQADQFVQLDQKFCSYVLLHK